MPARPEEFEPVAGESQGTDALGMSKRSVIGLIASLAATSAVPTGQAVGQVSGAGRGAGERAGDLQVNVLDFGVATANAAADNHAAFNRAIAFANKSRKALFVPAGTYSNIGTLAVLTGPGMFGEGAGNTVIHHLSKDSCLVARGSYIELTNLTIINKSPAGAGSSDGACFHLINCAYGRFSGLYAAHDLNDYSGILLEQRNEGSADDAAFLTHLGCWYNHFTGCTANYVEPGRACGYGIRFRVAQGARAVVDPRGQARGIYTGQCSYNIIDLPNIEQRSEGLRFEGGVCNQVRGGQFLGCDVQVRLIGSSANLFLGTRHNQWVRAAFVEEGGSDRNIILYPSLFQLSPQPWSLGRLAANSVAVRSDQSGTWSPRLTFGGQPVRASRASGTFANVGGVVQVNWDIRLADRPSGGAMEIGGLPFPAVNHIAQGVATCDLFLLDRGNSPAASAGRLGSGYCGSTTITGCADHMQDLTSAHFGPGAIILGKMTYFTPWT